MKKKAEATNEGFMENGKVESFEVKNVRQRKGVVYFTLNLNGVEINNCRVVELKDHDFVGLPSYKGSDGNYYSTVYFRFSDEDQQKVLDEVEKQLNS